ncbi:putative glycolipid-binding domain-containing protein [Virgisporangium aurantiacum]|uniref:Glycolipid-binding domain-containing protein n=1 Tax=Virgisporangium aurantiacum TaxID=175570 RepID=A0A8J3Z5B0_9ACTN|nr:putative glycolipid-binding domain-containing protein [Virgisporangium aurantiacum]GIJ57569.1 hypothetical protein Vau01_050850 [Virgisporangium aurantiacum]
MDVVWASLAWPGTEHLVLTVDSGGIRADSLAVHALPDGPPVRVGYTLTTDDAARTRNVSIEVTASARTERLTLRADGAGAWTDGDGRPIADLDGCLDVDISCTPLTNTFPIRRLGLAVGDSADLEMAYVTLPPLRVRKAGQRYTRLPDGPDGPVYRYESGTFRADLAVDADGLVVRYPELWRRTSDRASAA